MRQIALKIDVDTERGTREGVPNLARILHRFRAGATFLFSLGPDHTGRALTRVLRRGFLSKVGRTSVLSHYGLRTLLYGTLLPGPDIGLRHAQLMRRIRESGFDVGIHTYDHVKWQDQVARRDAAWTERELRLAVERFEEIFGDRPWTHGAAGWQLNEHALRLERAFGLQYCSDTRGAQPFVPVLTDGTDTCVQLPTTLPTLDELIGVAGRSAEDCVDVLLASTREDCPTGHVYTLHAELEGMKLAPVFERLLSGWRAQGYDLVSLGGYVNGLDRTSLPRCCVARGAVPGRSGELAIQGPALSRRKDPASCEPMQA